MPKRMEGKKVEDVFSGYTKNHASWHLYNADTKVILKDKLKPHSIDCIITSPPYFWLRDYGYTGQIGLEDSIDEYVNNIVEIFDLAQRILKSTGLLFLNLGDTYYSGKGASHGIDKKSSKRRFGLRAVDKSGGLGIGLKPKTLIGIPWRVATEMTKRGWILRSTIIWYRKNALPESVKDRPRRSYEYVFMFSKSKKYYFNREPLRQASQEDMWTITARPKANGIGTAAFPDQLVDRCLSIGCPKNGVVLDPFVGSGTTMRVALKSGRDVIGIDLSSEFCKYIRDKIKHY